MIELMTPAGDRAVVSLLGGQVLSWTPAGDRERLYLSERACWDGSAAIRGGVPVCFPQFSGLGPLPKHGLVRTRRWQADGVSGQGDSVTARLWVDDDAASRALWAGRFRLELAVTLAPGRLELALAARNTGRAPWAFTAALHGYLAVSDVAETRISGLVGLDYRDAAAGDEIRRQHLNELRFESETDRVYHDVRGPLRVQDRDRALLSRSEGFADCVIWNPGAARAAALPDLPGDDWRRMVCVEAAQAHHPLTLLPGGGWQGRQVFEVLP